MRLFVAVNFSQEVKEDIFRLVQELKGQSQNGTFTRRENIHLTLAFLGEVEKNRLQAVKDAMLAVEFPSLNIVFDHLGRFSRREGDIRWLGAKNNPHLLKLAQDLNCSLLEAGFDIDDRPFKPHLTLGRRVKASPLPPAGNSLENPIEVHCPRISLMHSQRLNGVLTYKEIFTVSAKS